MDVACDLFLTVCLQVHLAGHRRPVPPPSGDHHGPLLSYLCVPQGEMIYSSLTFSPSLQDHRLPTRNSRNSQRKTNNILFTISLTFCLRFQNLNTLHIDLIAPSWMPFCIFCISSELLDLFHSTGQSRTDLLHFMTTLHPRAPDGDVHDLPPAGNVLHLHQPRPVRLHQQQPQQGDQHGCPGLQGQDLDLQVKDLCKEDCLRLI